MSEDWDECDRSSWGCCVGLIAFGVSSGCACGMCYFCVRLVDYIFRN